MTEPLTGDSTSFVKIIHPETGGIAEVPESSLPSHYRAGWTLLTEENAPPAEAAPEEPAPMSEQDVIDAQAAKAEPAPKSSKSSKS